MTLAEKSKKPLESAAEKVRLFGDNAELTADEFAAYKDWPRRKFDDEVRAGRLIPFGGAGCQRRFHLRTNIVFQARAAGLKNDLIAVIASEGAKVKG